MDQNSGIFQYVMQCQPFSSPQIRFGTTAKQLWDHTVTSLTFPSTAKCATAKVFIAKLYHRSNSLLSPQFPGQQKILKQWLSGSAELQRAAAISPCVPCHSSLLHCMLSSLWQASRTWACTPSSSHPWAKCNYFTFQWSIYIPMASRRLGEF